MKIIQPSFTLHTPFGLLTEEKGIQLLRWIEANARISHRSEELQTEASWKRFIQAVVLDHGDWSVVEHSSVTAIMRVDRGVTHELVRHRLFSFTQESTRFVNYKKKGGDLEFIKPALLAETAENTWLESLQRSEIKYFELLDTGVRPQEARSVLPNALAATISVTGNLRNWRHFFLMRTSRETHPDFKAVTLPMLFEFQKKIPLLFDDIVDARQIDNLRKAR